MLSVEQLVLNAVFKMPEILADDQQDCSKNPKQISTYMRWDTVMCRFWEILSDVV